MKPLYVLVLSMIVAITSFYSLRVCAAGSDAGAVDAGSIVDAGISTAVDAGKVAVDAGAFVPVLPTPDDAGAFISAVVDATQNGSWRILGALAIVAAVWVTRKYGASKVTWLATKWGGVTLAIVYGILAQTVLQLASHDPMTVRSMINGAIQGVLASGFWSLIKGVKKTDTPPVA